MEGLDRILAEQRELILRKLVDFASETSDLRGVAYQLLWDLIVRRGHVRPSKRVMQVIGKLAVELAEEAYELADGVCSEIDDEHLRSLGLDPVALREALFCPLPEEKGEEKGEKAEGPKEPGDEQSQA